MLMSEKRQTKGQTGNEAFSVPTLQKLISRNTRLFQYCAQRAFGHVAGMVRDRGVVVGRGVEPDFMGACSLTMEIEAQRLEPTNNVSVAEPGEAAHAQPKING